MPTPAHGSGLVARGDRILAHDALAAVVRAKLEWNPQQIAAHLLIAYP